MNRKLATEFARLAAALFLLLALACHAAAADRTSPNQFLLASDIHFDPTADPSLVPRLVKADPSNWRSILQRSKPRQFSPYGQDTNWWLLQSSLDQMRKTMPHPAVFIIDGDLLTHHFQKQFVAATHDSDLEHYRAFVKKTVQFLAVELRRRWPETQILITPGNNDDDCQDYSINAHGAFLGDTASIARDLARYGDDLAGDWAWIGSYRFPPAAIGGLNILSFNSVFFSAKYQAQDIEKGCAKVPSDAAEQTFAWLERMLAINKQGSNAKVWLIFHIPPGIDGWASTHPKGGPVPPVGDACVKDIVPMWTPEWTERFNQLFEKYQDTIVASFAGHTHTDNFLVLPGTTGGSRGANQFVIVSPPISPIYGQNPAYRVFEFDRDKQVRNYQTYYLTDLTTPGKKLRGQWKLEYDFAQAWKAQPPINADNLGSIYSQITSSDAARQQWLTLYNVSSEGAKVPDSVIPGLYCVIEGLSVDAYVRCACASAK